MLTKRRGIKHVRSSDGTDRQSHELYIVIYLPVRIATFGGCVIKMHLLPESTDRQNVFH